MSIKFSHKDLRMVINAFKLNLRDRYMGSALGLFWAIINPLMFLGLYTFIFGFIFKAKVPGSETTFAYSIYLISGFVPYLAISESLNTSTSSIVSAASLVKNVVFKTECLPISCTLGAVVPFSVGMFFLLILLLINGNYPTWHVTFLIPIIILQFAFLSGLGFFLSATCVFIRDIVQIIPTITLMIVFFTPIFYSVEMMPEFVKVMTFYNPFYHMTQPYRDILLEHQLPNLKGMLYLFVLTLMLNLTGLKYFRSLKGYFTMAL